MLMRALQKRRATAGEGSDLRTAERTCPSISPFETYATAGHHERSQCQSHGQREREDSETPMDGLISKRGHVLAFFNHFLNN